MDLKHFTLFDLIERNALYYQNRPAWADLETDKAVTFAEYKTQVGRLANALHRNGLHKGDRIGLLGKNSLEYYFLFGAAAAMGAIDLPINWRLSADEIAYNLMDGSPKMLFIDPEFQELFYRGEGKLSCIEKYFTISEPREKFQAFYSLMDEKELFEGPRPETDDGFMIIDTAAVTGRQRGALLSHGNILCANLHFNHYFHIKPEDVHLNFLPFFHIGGITMAMLGFHAGALNINMPKFDAPKVTEAIEKYKVSYMMVFAPILALILDEQQKSDKNIHSLKSVTGLESPPTIERYQKLTGGTFYSMYGQTETSCLASFSPYNEAPGSAGRILPHADARVVDDHDRPVAPGKTGEILMRGPMVFKGYWGLPEDTAHTFRNSWHHTGDLGRFDEQGYLWYASRKSEKELIKPGGENVYPAEVENAVLQHPAIEKVVVIGVPDPKWKEGIKAVCQLKPGRQLDAQTLINFVGERIARYKKPHYVEFVTQWPLAPNGSIDREKTKKLHGRV